jgi:hypothetical protein
MAYLCKDCCKLQKVFIEAHFLYHQVFVALSLIFTSEIFASIQGAVFPC